MKFAQDPIENVPCRLNIKILIISNLNFDLDINRVLCLAICNKSGKIPTENVPSKLYTRTLTISNLWPWPLTLNINSVLCFAIWNMCMRCGQDLIKNVPSMLYTMFLTIYILWPFPWKINRVLPLAIENECMVKIH